MSALTYQVGSSVDLTFSCNGYTCADVNLTVLFPNTTLYVDNQETTDNGYYANYTIIPETNGEYIYYYSDGANQSARETFIINGSGLEFGIARSIFYIGILSLFVFLFILVNIGIAKLPNGNPTTENGEYIKISWLKYLRPTFLVIAWGILVIILYVSSALASAYLESGIYDILFMFFRLSTLFTVPVVILYFLWLFVSIFDDRKIKKMMDRGVLSPLNWKIKTQK